MDESTLQALHHNSEAVVRRSDARLEKRLGWVGEQVTIVEYIEHVDDPDDMFDWVTRPNHGSLLAFHMVITDNDGPALEDTRTKGEPIVAPVVGDLPAGILWALRTMGYDEKMTLNIPPALAVGPDYGVLRVELEIVEGPPNLAPRPTPRDSFGYPIGTVDAQESPSGLRYRELIPGEGDPPKRDRGVRIHAQSQNALGDVLRDSKVITATVGADDMFAGVSKALRSMSPRSQNVLFVPRHLADTSREVARRATCQVSWSADTFEPIHRTRRPLPICLDMLFAGSCPMRTWKKATSPCFTTARH
jgi:FKBP-type peptidyl-prolyl cis-trans isomerase